MTSSNPIPRVVAVHDLSGLGRVALMVVIPILSSMGIQVTPLPTAVLSANTNFKDFKMLDLSEQMKLFLEHWKTQDIYFDAIYTGFLGSSIQVDIVKDLIKNFCKKRTLTVIDPVLGDDGRSYTTVDNQLIKKMSELISYADVITPNLTEVFLLLNKPFKKCSSIDELKDIAHQLACKGPKTVIITSVDDYQKKNLTSVIAYDRLNNKFWKVSCSYIPATYPGTGDVFSSVLTGCLLQGDTLPIALDRAVNFTSIAVRTTYGRNYDYKEGVIIEKILDTLKSPVMVSSYEII
jgi:pyridoxine kinase